MSKQSAQPRWNTLQVAVPHDAYVELQRQARYLGFHAARFWRFLELRLCQVADPFLAAKLPAVQDEQEQYRPGATRGRWFLTDEDRHLVRRRLELEERWRQTLGQRSDEDDPKKQR